ncbi:MAG TPA: hypothetical protein VF815_40360 [Myxococcaceae bacterium]|jgi:hypothetical protein
MLGLMASVQFLTLGLLAVLVLAAAGAAGWWYRRRVWLQQRQASWQELRLRLELVPQPGNARVAQGELRESHFLLHDTGTDWWVELPLAQPLLPPGMVLLSSDAPTPQPPLHLRPLEWGVASVPPKLLSWHVEVQEPDGKVEVPPAFLEEATRAVREHAPLRVESRRMIHALRAGALLPVSQVREAVRALYTTASRWREVAEREGLPRVQLLPPPQPEPAPPQPEPAPPQPEPVPRPSVGLEPPGGQAPSRASRERWARHREVLKSVLKRREGRRALGFLNLGVPGCLLLHWWGGEETRELFIFVVLFLWVSAFIVELSYYSQRFRVGRPLVWALWVSASVGAPLAWIYGTTNSEVRMPELRWLGLGLWGVPNALWLAWVFTTCRRELLGVRELPEVEPLPVKEPSQESPRRSGKRKKKKKGRKH